VEWENTWETEESLKKFISPEVFEQFLKGQPEENNNDVKIQSKATSTINDADTSNDGERATDVEKMSIDDVGVADETDNEKAASNKDGDKMENDAEDEDAGLMIEEVPEIFVVLIKAL